MDDCGERGERCSLRVIATSDVTAGTAALFIVAVIASTAKATALVGTDGEWSGESEKSFICESDAWSTGFVGSR
jgi:hypothetical protein